MSIATELAALKQSVTNIYNKIQERGGTIPEKKNLDNIPSAVESIPDKDWDIKPSEKIRMLAASVDVEPQTLVKFVNGSGKKINHIILKGQPLGFTTTGQRLYFKDIPTNTTKSLMSGSKGAMFNLTEGEQKETIIITPNSVLDGSLHGMIGNVVNQFNVDTTNFNIIATAKKKVSVGSNDVVSSLFEYVPGVYLGLWDYSINNSEGTTVAAKCLLLIKYCTNGVVQFANLVSGITTAALSAVCKAADKTRGQIVVIGTQNYSYYRISQGLTRVSENIKSTKVFTRSLTTLFNSQQIRDFYFIATTENAPEVHVITNAAEYDLLINSNANSPTQVFTFVDTNNVVVDLKEAKCMNDASGIALCRYARKIEGTLNAENLLGIKENGIIYPLKELGVGYYEPQFLHEDYILGLALHEDTGNYYTVIVSNVDGSIRYNIYQIDFTTKKLKFIDSIKSKSYSTDLVRNNNFPSNQLVYIDNDCLYFTDCHFINSIGDDNNYRDNNCAEYVCYDLSINYAIEKISENEQADGLTETKCTTTQTGNVWVLRGRSEVT